MPPVCRLRTAGPALIGGRERNPWELAYCNCFLIQYLSVATPAIMDRPKGRTVEKVQVHPRRRLADLNPGANQESGQHGGEIDGIG
jgi:hypothetical protein